MKTKIFVYIVCSLFYFGCTQSGNHDPNRHKQEGILSGTDHEHNEADPENAPGNEHQSAAEAVHNHPDDAETDEEHSHAGEEVKIKFTAYSPNFELFAEADPFSEGKSSHILAHFSTLPDFDPLTKAEVNIKLLVKNTEVNQTATAPVRPGIYSFEIVPEEIGNGTLLFSIEREGSTDTVVVENVVVYSNEHEAIHEAEDMAEGAGQNIVFTKEQSWKIDFATTPVSAGPFGQIIKTTAQVQPAPEDELLLSAKTGGIVQFISNSTVEGQHVSNGQALFVVSGSGLAENNMQIRLSEAQNNFEQAKANYERAQNLARDRIISEKELLDARTRYQNTKSIYESLSTNFNSDGQKVTAAISGFINRLFVKNGEYVATGQPLASISQNKTLLLQAGVQPKYVSILSDIKSATIQQTSDNTTYTLDELNGRILSVGKTTGANSFLIPVILIVENKADFVPGSFVDLYLQTETGNESLTVPNNALLEEQGNFFVLVQVNPELFEKREVKPGVSNGTMTQILRGLSPGERVVSEGAVMVKLAQSSGTLDAHAGHVH